jgi:hypothetical protein
VAGAAAVAARRLYHLPMSPLRTSQFVLISDVNRVVHVINLEQVVQLVENERESTATIQLTNREDIKLPRGDHSRGMMDILQGYNSQADPD